ncbi:MAG: MBL fold metallo-hydrolase, partial [Syntrophomonadaceae bacterium]|nr:MBL fold metallo-hydrolase [Syntrophomonadaceae bacterium]
KMQFGIDCGLFQGPKEIKERNYKEFVIDPSSLDFLILTHAHIDHIGLVPKLVKHGFKGPIYCSHATEELASVLLPDSGYIQESEVERKNRKLKRAGKLLIEPIYTVEDALNSLKQFRSLNSDEIIEIAEGIEVRLRDAGHILGSNILEIWVEEKGEKIKLVFTGDLGNSNQPIVKDPTIIESADYVIMESTYGNRYHKGVFRRTEQLKEIIENTMAKGGNLIIPSFAVERTQDLLYDLNNLYDNGELDENIDIYIDSPLAIAATEIFERNIEYYDHDSRQLIEQGKHPLHLPNLKFSRTQEDSMKLNEVQSGAIIISASGMCDAGRIKHHLKHNLWRPECTVLFVGYQAIGTLGRRIVDGEKLVRIHGEQVAVKADIESIEAYSAHADKAGLISWLKNFVLPPKAVFLVHGEVESQISLAEYIRSELGIQVFIPDWLEEFELKPSEKVLPKQFVGENMDKAMIAEEMYLDLRLKLHNMFKEYWQRSEFDKIIQEIKRLEKNIS